MMVTLDELDSMMRDFHSKTHAIMLDIAERQKARRQSEDHTGQLIEAGACMWEAYLDKTLTGQAQHIADTYRERHGTSSLRLLIIEQSEACHKAWWAQGEMARMDEPFDWEFCPRWLSEWIESGGLGHV